MKYDPFARGKFPVGVRSIEALDTSRNCLFPFEVWYPAAAEHAGQDLTPATQDVFTVSGGSTPRAQAAVRDATAQAGSYPLIVFSHHSTGNRRAATFLTTHLSSHGYIVAAIDHSEVVSPALARKDGETAELRSARAEAWVANRVPDMRFLIEHLLKSWDSEARIDSSQIGIIGHSFGGWTALATPEVEPRIRAVVALAPGGNSKPRPGIIPAKLTFEWGRNVPTLYLVAENDVPLPLEGMYELFERTSSAKQMVILRRADHVHFIDDVEEAHEGFRTMPATGALAEFQKEMLPISELCSGEQAHVFVSGLALSHMDATLKRDEEARRFLGGDIKAALAARSIDVIVYKP